MTSLVGVACTDGVVIGSDSSATFGPNDRIRTIEQTYDQKVQIIGSNMIIAGTGSVGHGQRFQAVVERQHKGGSYNRKTIIDIAKSISKFTVEDFAETHSPVAQFLAIAAYVGSDGHALCQFLGDSFQPEISRLDGLWFATLGSGQSITDSFAAYFRKVFWNDRPPNVQGGIFMATAALMHVCEVNAGGIKDPIHIAVLEKEGDTWVARKLTADQLAEHQNMVEDSTRHMRDFLKVLAGETDAQEPPKLPEPSVAPAVK